jgi:hypothetical protein
MSSMPLLPIQPVSPRNVVVSTTAVEGLQLAIGQEVSARILAINAQGELLLDMKNRRLWAESDLPLQPGRTMNMKVLETSPSIQLQLISAPEVPESPQELTAMAQLILAQKTETELETEFHALPLLEALKNLLPSSDGGKPNIPLEQLKQILAPLTAGEDPRQFLQNLKIQMENSGLFFEARLRTLLETFSAAPEGALGKMSSDLKVLLGQVNQEFEKIPPPLPPPLQVFIGRLEELIALIQPETMAGQALPRGQPSAAAPTSVPENINEIPTPSASEAGSDHAQPLTQGFVGELRDIQREAASQAAAAAGNLQRVLEQALSGLQNVRFTLSSTPPAEADFNPTASQSAISAFANQLLQIDKDVEVLKTSPDLALQHLSGQLKSFTPGWESLLSTLPETVRSMFLPQLASLHKITLQVDQTLRQTAMEAYAAIQNFSDQLRAIIARAEGDPSFSQAKFKLDPALIQETLRTIRSELQGRMIEPAQPSDLTTIWKLAGELKGALADQLLAKQADAALHWLQDGSFEAVVPLQYQLFQSSARIRFQIDPEGRKSKGKNRRTTVDIRLELPGWGKVEAWARWFEKQIDVKLYLENAGIVSVLEKYSADLSAALLESGFRQVNIEVHADPVRLYKENLTWERVTPEGKLLSIRV